MNLPPSDTRGLLCFGGVVLISFVDSFSLLLLAGLLHRGEAMLAEASEAFSSLLSILHHAS